MPDVNREPPNENHDQSLVFRKDKWSKNESRQWLEGEGYFTDGYDETENQHRWRQYDTNSDKFEYRMSERGEGIKAVYAIKK